MNYLAFIMAGLFCGFVDSCLGMGFGVTSASVLITFGVAPAIASASVHAAEAVVDLVSGVSHWKLGNVDMELGVRMLVPGVVAAVLGALFLSGLSLGIAKTLMRVVLLALGLYILYRHWNYKPPEFRQVSKARAYLLGFVASFIDVAVGGGWGPLGTPALLLMGVEPKKVVGTIEFTEPFISVAAVITFGFTLGFDSFLWGMAIPMIIGGVLLTPIAAFVTNKVPAKTLGILIGVWLVALNLYGLIQG